MLRVPSFQSRLKSKATLPSASRRSRSLASGGRRMYRGVRFAEPLAQDRVHLPVARCGGESDRAALFQVAQDTRSGPAYDTLDILLGGLGRGVEEGMEEQGEASVPSVGCGKT